MDKEKKIDSEKPTEVLTSSPDITQFSDSTEASQPSNSSLGYLADSESGGFSSAHFSQDSPFLASSYDSDSLGILEDLKESSQKNSFDPSAVTQEKVTPRQEDQSSDGEVTGTNPVKVKSFDDILEIYDSDSQSSQSQPSSQMDGKKMGNPDLLLLSVSESENESSQKSSSLEMLEDFS